jgi:SAM-dependent methyltransferase
VTADSTARRPGSPSRPAGSAASAEGRAGAPDRTHWFEDLADHLGPTYERYAFTRGTDQEVAFLVEALGLAPGLRVVDLGCGTGRHCRGLAARGLAPIGLDVSAAFLAAAVELGATTPLVRADVRRLPLRSGSVDVAVSLCQGGFGLTGGPAAADTPVGVEPDEVVLAEVARILAPGGRVALSAFSSYFAVRDLGEHEAFDAAAGVVHECTVVHDPQGRPADVDLWTTCYTPRELRLLFRHCGLEVEALWSVRPGRYAAEPPGVDSPEYLAVARRPR